MCVSLPGKVVQIDGPVALVEMAGRTRAYNALLFPELEQGARVLVHAGMVMSVLSEEEAQEIDAAFDELLRIDGGASAENFPTYHQGSTNHEN